MELCHLFDIWAVSADRDRVEVEVGVVHYQGLAARAARPSQFCTIIEGINIKLIFLHM